MSHYRLVTLFSSAARAEATYNSADVTVEDNPKGCLVHLDITAETGTATLDVKLQYKDQISGKYTDIPGASFAQQSATGNLTLLLYPGIAETANREVSVVLSRVFRAVATVGGTSVTFTFSVSCELLP